tara:strand:+ start:41 stop:550 length:510 start_codon:yes stop_codon:yes gene_type:complete
MIYKLLSRLGIEVWKDVPEYKGHYQVSNLGNVINIKFNKIKYIKYLNGKGRYAVTLYKNNIPSHNRRISVLVAQAFLNHKRCGHKLVVDHIDNNKLNDKLYNIQVITNRENLTKDKTNKTGYTGVYKCTNGKSFFSEIRIGKTRKYLGRFKTPKEASQAYKKELNKIKL